MMKIATVAALAAALAAVVAFAGVGRPSAAHGSSAQAQRTITVDGVGTVRGMPDTAQVSFGVEEERATAQAALSAAGDKMRRILAALREAGIANADLQTQDVSVYPRTTPSGAPDGFSASTTVSATVHDVSRTGKVVEAAVAAGADNTSGPELSRADTTSLTEQALRDAFRNAHAKAQALAQEAGGQLGGLLRIEESGQAPQPIPYFATADLQRATPIARGTQTVQANVTVTFSLE
jgi:uncharacterized protein YggE